LVLHKKSLKKDFDMGEGCSDDCRPMKTSAAKLIAHTLSNPSKMPCFGYSIPASKCITGSKLKGIKDSICSICYAGKGRYSFENVQTALRKRFDSLTNPLWVDAIVALISNKRKPQTHFRWHDSGDIQGVGHLTMIVEIAKRLPNISFWLPTREYSMVGEYLTKVGEFPKNLCVRLSTFMVDGELPKSIAERYGLTTSGVSKDGFTCPAPKQNNFCLDCRACWDKNVPNINYKVH
jgi:hypothetical protein